MPKKPAITISIIVLLIAIAGVVIYKFALNSNPQLEEVSSKTFTSEILKDGKVPNTSSDLKFTGITNIKILSDNKLIMSIDATGGVGPIRLCTEGAKFLDTDEEAYEEEEEFAEKQNLELELKDITNQNYSEANFLGRRIRLLDHKIYFNKVENPDNSKFNPECAYSTYYLGFPDLQYTQISPTNTVSKQYLYQVSYFFDELNNADLKNLADYLNNLKVE